MMLNFIMQVSALSFDSTSFSLWGSGESWMLLAAQSMAIGTVMVRWVSKYSDPIMATGWVGSTIPLISYYLIVHPSIVDSIFENLMDPVWVFLPLIVNKFKILTLNLVCLSVNTQDVLRTLFLSFLFFIWVITLRYINSIFFNNKI